MNPANRPQLGCLRSSLPPPPPQKNTRNAKQLTKDFDNENSLKIPDRSISNYVVQYIQLFSGGCRIIRFPAANPVIFAHFPWIPWLPSWISQCIRLCVLIQTVFFNFQTTFVEWTTVWENLITLITDSQSSGVCPPPPSQKDKIFFN